MERTHGDAALAFWVFYAELVVAVLCNMEVHVKRLQATDRWLRLDTPTSRDDIQSS